MNYTRRERFRMYFILFEDIALHQKWSTQCVLATLFTGLERAAGVIQLSLVTYGKKLFI